jgi:hypothetical protein
MGAAAMSPPVPCLLLSMREPMIATTAIATATAAMSPVLRYRDPRIPADAAAVAATPPLGRPCGSLIASINFARADSRFGNDASIHCDSLKKYSSAGVSGAASIRSAMIGRFLDEARSTSLPTCEEWIALSDKTKTSALASAIARTIASA